MSATRLFSVKLNDGYFMPVLGLGTSAPPEVAKSKVEGAIETAIDVGYRHIDSSCVYLNEEEIGKAIQKKIANGTVKRDDIFFSSKLWLTFFRPKLVQTALEMSLRKLQLSYVDLFLIHFPTALKPGEEIFPKDSHGKIIFDTVDLCSTWEALEKCKEAGLAKSIGVSNFNRRQLEMILNKSGLKYKPVCNQVECHLYLNQSKLLEFCKSKDIVLIAYSALGSDPKKDWVKKDNPVLLEDPVLNAIADKHQRTPAQVALRYQLQRGVVVLAKSFSEKRIQENFQVFDFQLTPEDMKTLDGLNRNIRFLNVTLFADHPDFPFHDEY
ncbi:aldo-keto reductase family 1 member C1 homolog isoform X13 [Phyllostomus discolor]|uniref:Aldo-keto reductase family 1 member C1 homolog isoform X13 n=1 Tax=Phyllostomus discolor TaxID=89673 RepID=A0A6J2L2Y0_9CHIR|nr:aldo-keto reductase family 1 member C1 homolog isoform X13 [Phyllostomus discolor]XP_035880957.1 aldo-keto reductase family 1 member C1 homolog isoform X13 [Phyllostomus discolor]XP_035880958.1 aldo-keto reductase family 1 member C1 homolog isoform X13 [Phyllostomus discolor]